MSLQMFQGRIGVSGHEAEKGRMIQKAGSKVQRFKTCV